MLTFELHGVLANLAQIRPVFHHEADFQHALAWQIHSLMPTVSIRLEYKPFPRQPVFVDIWLVIDGRATAIELKYLTTRCEVSVDGELFALAQQAAGPVRRYDVIKDIQRLERIVHELPNARGYMVCLTNDATMWNPTSRLASTDAAYRIDEGRTLTGELSWAAQTGIGTMKNRETPIQLAGAYQIRWRDYASVPAERSGRLRYLLLEVGTEQTRAVDRG